MKNIFLISLLSINILANDIYDVQCPKDLGYNVGNGNIGVDYWVYDGEDYIYGNWTEVLFEAWDSRSAVCGGELDKNILLEFACDWNNDYCYDNNYGIGNLQFIDYNSEYNIYENNTIIANHIPCVDYETITYPAYISHTLYNADTNEIYNEYVSFPIDYQFESTEYILTEEEAKALRSFCNKTDIKPYVDELELQRKTIRDQSNTSINTEIFDLKSFTEQLNFLNLFDNDYSSIATPGEPTISNDLDSFTSEYTNILTDTFLNNGSILGFDDFGTAPEDITFEMFGNTYTVFSKSMFDSIIDYIRNTIISFAYIWGCLIVFKDIKDA